MNAKAASLLIKAIDYAIQYGELGNLGSYVECTMEYLINNGSIDNDNGRRLEFTLHLVYKLMNAVTK